MHRPRKCVCQDRTRKFLVYANREIPLASSPSKFEQPQAIVAQYAFNLFAAKCEDARRTLLSAWQSKVVLAEHEDAPIVPERLDPTVSTIFAVATTCVSGAVSGAPADI